MLRILPSEFYAAVRSRQAVELPVPRTSHVKRPVRVTRIDEGRLNPRSAHHSPCPGASLLIIRITVTKRFLGSFRGGEGADAFPMDKVLAASTFGSIYMGGIRSSQQSLSGTDGDATSVWKERYATRHQLVRIKEFPAGVTKPKRVRLYSRQDHFMLQWWDPSEKRTVSQRIDGDLIDAIAAARSIDEKLCDRRSPYHRPRSMKHADAVAKFVADLDQRANAGEIDPKTVTRYSSAVAHFRTFVDQPHVARKWPSLSRIDREFQLAFAAYLNGIQISPNGHNNSRIRPMKGQDFVLDVVRSLLEWAADSERGKLLPDGFRNPFILRKNSSNRIVVDPICSLDITVGMAVDLAMAADSFQLGIFAPMLLYGLRPGELGWLFRENAGDDWLRVACVKELDYTTKGRRDKRLPIVDCLKKLWNTSGVHDSGLLFVKRRVAEGRISVPLLGQSLAALVDEYRCRCTAANSLSAAKKRQLRNRLMKEAGQLNYDHVEGEFRKLTRQLKWPANATLKDLRHLFATCLENAGVPEFYRRYFMGQSFGKAPIVTYTHLTGDKLREHFKKAIDTEMRPIQDAIISRTNELARSANTHTPETKRDLP